MSISVPKEDNGKYWFECDDHTYTYRTRNNRKYSNQEFMNILLTSHKTYDYYNEPCTMWNDYDGNLVMFPREEKEDDKFFKSVSIILEHTSNEEKKQLINDILNNCLVIDKEPVLLGNGKISDRNVDFTNVKNYGSYHIDRYKLPETYRDAINYAAHKYIKEYNYKNHYSAEDEKDLELLTKLD